MYIWCCHLGSPSLQFFSWLSRIHKQNQAKAPGYGMCNDCTHQLDWDKGWTNIWSNIILDVFDEIHIRIHRLSKRDGPPWCEWALSHQLGAWTKQKTDKRKPLLPDCLELEPRSFLPWDWDWNISSSWVSSFLGFSAFITVWVNSLKIYQSLYIYLLMVLFLWRTLTSTVCNVMTWHVYISRLLFNPSFSYFSFAIKCFVVVKGIIYVHT